MAAHTISTLMATYMSATVFSGGYEPKDPPVLIDTPPIISLHPIESVCEAIVDGADRPHPDPQVLPPEEITLTKPDGTTVKLDVEIARTPEEQSHGLMYREDIPYGTGMLFVDVPKGQDGEIAIWMKDTYVPLDIVFLDKDGNVVKIVENAQACDLDKITGGPDANSILELPAGSVAMYGIEEGDKVAQPEPEPENIEEMEYRAPVEKPRPPRPYGDLTL